MIEIQPPKPDNTPIYPGPYCPLNQHCAYHDCNRLYVRLATWEEMSRPLRENGDN